MKRQPRYKKGDRIGGRYLVHQALMGGMGEVYLCLDLEDIVPRALKTFQSSSPGLREIFQQEVANWIALEKHPNIVQCFWMQTFDNIPFMALEWVVGEESKGTDLRSWLRHTPLPLDLALRLTIDICRGLQHAGERVPGIVHRDLKPDNVLVNQGRQAKITDFGLATIVQQSRLIIDTSNESSPGLGHSMRIGNIVGTPAYMAPEQWRGELDLDFRTDMYAVGCIMYELLTGRWLYEGGTLRDLRIQHLEAPIPSMSGDFPEEVKCILDGCLAKQRAARFERLDLLLAALTQFYEMHSGERLANVKLEEFTAYDYNNRGVTFGGLGQHEKAIQDYNAALHLDPNLASVYLNRGNSYGELGQHEQAIADFDRAIALDPKDAKAYSNRGNSYGELGQHEQAIADFDRAIALDPTLSLTYSNRGTRYWALGQQEQAIADFDRAIALDPKDASVYSNRGSSYMALDQCERAIADYGRAIELDPNYAPAYYNRGNSHYSLGQYEQAIADYDRAIQLAPNEAQIYISRGLQHANVKVPGIVHRDLKPDNILVNQSHQAKITDFGLAMMAQRSGIEAEIPDSDSAALGYSMQVGNAIGTPYYMPPEQWRGETNLDFRTDLYALGCIFYELLTGVCPYMGDTVSEVQARHLGEPIPSLKGDFPSGVKRVLDGCLAKRREDRFARVDSLLIELTQLYESHSGESLADVIVDKFAVADYVNRGVTFNNLGQYERAIEDFDEAVRLDPNLATTYSNRSTSYRALGQYERAIADCDKAIRLDPALAPAYSNRGMCYGELGRYERAITDCDEAIRLDPALDIAYYNRGVSYDELGQYERAIADYDEAIRLDPTDSTVYLNKAVSLAKTRRFEEAIEWGQKAAWLGAPRAGEFINQVRHEETEQTILQLISHYQQRGEAGLRQVLQQEGVPPTGQIDQLIIGLRRALGE